MNITDLISHIRRLPGCSIYEPQGTPIAQNAHVVPDDLRQFYDLCGGLTLFATAKYSITVVPPNELVLANPVIIGDLAEDDISSSWYIIARDPDNEYLTIDLSQDRLGRCYDSFFDRHAVPGSCPTIASSFTELLTRLVENGGRHWYWLEPSFDQGDAYD